MVDFQVIPRQSKIVYNILQLQIILYRLIVRSLVTIWHIIVKVFYIMSNRPIGHYTYLIRLIVHNEQKRHLFYCLWKGHESGGGGQLVRIRNCRHHLRHCRSNKYSLLIDDANYFAVRHLIAFRV